MEVDPKGIETDQTRIGNTDLTRIMGKLLYEKKTYEIRGACFWVWKEFGGAFKESVIHNALLGELQKRGLTVETKKQIPLYYDDKKVGAYVPDLVVNNSVLIELKCKPFLTKEDERQFWHYLKAASCPVGLLINFGSKTLEIKRRTYTKKIRA